jgi:S-adenosylmethionine:tRNA ribosyltransferase-isomerase
MRWRAFARPAKRCAVGDIVEFAPGFFATVTARGDEGEVELGFNVTGPALDAAIAQNGSMPLPPYIVRKRPADRQDASDYQTIFAAREGAVAAPTAGLHFTPDLMHRLRAAGIGDTQITLHVGAGTFLPVKVSDTDEHRMHAEWGEITPSTAAAINRARVDGRIVAVGTTCLRLLESACNESRQVEAFAGETQIFIIPGKPIRSTDALITNFHLPRSTLFMLVCAFCGTAIMKAAYAHAINKGYRFYSYGDACLLFPGKDRLKESHERAPAV